MGKEENKYTVGKLIKGGMEGKTQNLTLIVAEDFSLRCKYCYITHKSNVKVMDFEIVKKFIDYIFENQPHKMEGVILDFKGGETQLEVELIDKICVCFKLKAYSINNDCLSFRKM